MTNLEKYKNAFIEGLDISDDGLEDLVFEGIPEWDSVGHMSLVACIEEAFDIMLETDDIIDFNSFKKGIELLKKYDIEI
jgi:acyl carrier protein